MDWDCENWDNTNYEYISQSERQITRNNIIYIDNMATLMTEEELAQFKIIEEVEYKPQIENDRLIAIVREFYGDLLLAEPLNELTETINDLELTEEECKIIGIESAIKYLKGN